MSDVSLQQATDNIYASLKADNADLLDHIAVLKAAMAREGVKEAVFEPAKLAQEIACADQPDSLIDHGAPPLDVGVFKE